ncbi:hypothetical protein D3C72_1327740 [compost metagenome]
MESPLNVNAVFDNALSEPPALTLTTLLRPSSIHTPLPVFVPPTTLPLMLTTTLCSLCPPWLCAMMPVESEPVALSVPLWLTVTLLA